MSTQLIYKKMSDVMKDVKSVSKNQVNSVQNFKFRGIDQFVNALYPALTKHGVFMTPRAISYTQELREVTRSNGKLGVDKHVAIMMEYDFYAEDGSKVTVGPIPAEGLDSGDKSTNKALSAALKYALIQTFSVPTEDMAEADLDSPEIGADKKTEPSNFSKVISQTSTTVTNPEPPKKIASFRKPKPEAAPVVLNGATGVNNGNGASSPASTDEGWK